jgi:hypothetical protein
MRRLADVAVGAIFGAVLIIVLAYWLAAPA